MADFKKAIPIILQYEGGLSKNKTDKAAADPVPDGSGNHTNKGITWTTFKGAASKYGFTATAALFYQMPDTIWTKIAKGMYWDVISGDQLKSDSVAILLADWQFGSGTNATKNLQQVLNRSFGQKLTEDGQFGPKTLVATNAANQTKLFQLLQAERIDYYNQLVAANPSQQAFYSGWINDAMNTFNKASVYAKGAISVALLGFFLEQPFW
jgi:lysozyme family protein